MGNGQPALGPESSPMTAAELMTLSTEPKLPASSRQLNALEQGAMRPS
jgi:hypothetical protein